MAFTVLVLFFEMACSQSFAVNAREDLGLLEF